MTNCPNCGAPYALDSPVCEYCGTARELSKEERRKINITVDNSAMGEVMRRRFLELRGDIDPFESSEQTALQGASLSKHGFQDVQQAARKTVTPESEVNDEKITLKEWLTALSIPIISVILFADGIFGMSHTKDVINSIFGILTICGAGGVLFSCLEFGVAILMMFCKNAFEGQKTDW